MASVFGETMSPVLGARGSGYSPGGAGILHWVSEEKMRNSVCVCTKSFQYTQFLCVFYSGDHAAWQYT